MHRMEIIRGIIGILLFVAVFGVFTYRMLTSPKETTVEKNNFSCYAHVVEQEDKMVISEDLLKIEEEKQILFDEVEYYAVRSEKEPTKNPYFPYSTVEYKTESGESFSVNLETGEVIEFISGKAEKKENALSDSDRMEIAKRYVNEISDVEKYRQSNKEMNGYYIYDFVKYVEDFKTTDEIKVTLLEDGSLYMLSYRMIGEFDELFETDDKTDKNNSHLYKGDVDKAVQEQIKKQFGDTVTYEEKDMTIVKRRNGEFAVLVVADISDEKGELIAVREQYYVTWE